MDGGQQRLDGSVRRSAGGLASRTGCDLRRHHRRHRRRVSGQPQRRRRVSALFNVHWRWRRRRRYRRRARRARQRLRDGMDRVEQLSHCRCVSIDAGRRRGCVRRGVQRRRLRASVCVVHRRQRQRSRLWHCGGPGRQRRGHRRHVFDKLSRPAAAAAHRRRRVPVRCVRREDWRGVVCSRSQPLDR